MIEELNVQGLGKVMLDLQSHFAPTTERQAAGHLSLQAGRGQAFEANGVEYRQDQQCQQQSPVDRRQTRWHRDVQRPQCAQDDADDQQDREPDQQQARGFHRPRRRHLIEQLPQHVIDLQPFDVQLRREAYAMAQHRQGAALDVIRNHELAAAQQARARAQRTSAMEARGPAPRVSPGQLRVVRARRTA